MSNTKVKLDLFFPQKGESMDNPLGKYERNQMIISSVTCMQNVTKNVKIVSVFRSAEVNLHNFAEYMVLFLTTGSELLFSTCIPMTQHYTLVLVF